MIYRLFYMSLSPIPRNSENANRCFGRSPSTHLLTCKCFLRFFWSLDRSPPLSHIIRSRNTV